MSLASLGDGFPMLMELWLEETDNRWKENDASSARQRGSSGSIIGSSRREKKMQQRARENAGAAARFAAIRLLAVEQEEAGMRFKQFLERRRATATAWCWRRGCTRLRPSWASQSQWWRAQSTLSRFQCQWSSLWSFTDMCLGSEDQGTRWKSQQKNACSLSFFVYDLFSLFRCQFEVAECFICCRCSTMVCAA